MAYPKPTIATSTQPPSIGAKGYQRVCIAKNCTNIARFACDEHLCLACATKQRKGQTIEIQPRRKKL